MRRTNQGAQAFRWGQLTSGLESAQASLKLALRASDLLSAEANTRLHDALNILASVEQRSWVIYNAKAKHLPPGKKPAPWGSPKRGKKT